MVKSLYGIDEETSSLWVFLEQDGSALAGVSLELLARGGELAAQLGWKLIGFLPCRRATGWVEEAFAHGADEVLTAEDPLLAHFTVEAYTQVAYEAVIKHKPSIFLLGATPNGRELAGRLAVRLRTGLNADCTDLRVNPAGVLVSEVSGFGGGVLALIEMAHHRPQMATVRPGVFLPAEPAPGRQGEVVRVPVELPAGLITTRVVERLVGEGVDLTQSPVLVVGGRGVGDNFEMLYELAELLGGEVGATRPPVDEGYIERARQIGQTGVVCRPDLAIVCGVSGAFHFTVGIQEAGTVIAINTDPEAPIFEAADYGIVGDVHEVIPAIIRELQVTS